ncbi:MAG: ROK family transcriptional regulator [Clostridia bacterium]|nr:ROK family transcriptional regulator [Clostridia bacterium]
MSERKGFNNTHLKYRNRGIVLRLIANEDLSRIDITKRMGLTRMAITNIVSELIAEGYVVEGKTDENAQVGRNPILLDVAPASPLVAGVCIARNSLFAILTDIRLTALYIDEIPLQDESEASLKEKLCLILDRLFAFRDEKMPARKILGIGVSAPGPLDPKNGVLLNPQDFFFIENLPLKDFLEERYRMPVFTENDMNAAALAELLRGSAQNCGNFLYLGVTTGIGAGIVVDHRLYGRDSISVGEIGHMCINFNGPTCSCGNKGCLETYATMPIIMERLKEASGKENIALTDFEELSEDEACHKVFMDVAGKLAHALINAVNLLDPECVVIGHEGVFLPEKYLKEIQHRIEKRILATGYKSVPVYPSAFSLGAPVYGSAAMVLNHLFEGELI